MLFQPPFGEWVKQRRKQLDLTREQLAQRASYSVDTVRKFETSALRPSRQAAESLATALDIPSEQRSAFIGFARGSEMSRIENLPNPATSMVGREDAIAAVLEMLRDPDVRLVTLIGPPGVGKTRLAIEIAHRALDLFTHGTCFVPLAHITHADDVPGVVGDQLGLLHHHAAGVSPFLRDRQLLLVLDNFEQVLGAATHIAEWLSAAPGLKVLVTSRAMLHLSAENLYPVQPLVLPDTQHLPAMRELERVPAINLFMQRAKAVNLNMTLTPANARDIAAICNYLDGLPLALELAAGRVRMFTPHTLADRLNHVVGARLRFLTAGSHDLPTRQQTLRGAIEWSNALLSEPEQRLIRGLGVFVNGFTLNAAQAVCAKPDQSPDDITAYLQTLVDHSLVQMREGLENQPRYSLLESLRDFALEQLTQHGELEQMRLQHARFFGARCAALDHNAPGWAYECTLALRWVASERANLLAAMLTNRANDDEPALHLYISFALSWLGYVGHNYWGLTDRVPLYDDLEWSLARNPHLPLTRRAQIVGGLGMAASFLGANHSPLALFEQAAALSHDAGAFQFEAIMLSFTAGCYFDIGDLDTAEKYKLTAHQINRELNDDLFVMGDFTFLGGVAICKHDYARADDLLNQALALSRKVGVRAAIGGGESHILLRIGLSAYRQIQYDRARDALQLALQLCIEAGEINFTADAHFLLAIILMARGDLNTAEHHLRTDATMTHDYGWQPGKSLAYHARLCQLRSDTITFMRLAGYVAAHPPDLQYEFMCLRDEINTMVSQARAGLNDPALAAAWAGGQALSDAEALDEVL